MTERDCVVWERHPLSVLRDGCVTATVKIFSQEHTSRPLRSQFYTERGSNLACKQSFISHSMPCTQFGDSIFPVNIDPHFTLMSVLIE